MHSNDNSDERVDVICMKEFKLQHDQAHVCESGGFPRAAMTRKLLCMQLTPQCPSLWYLLEQDSILC